MMELYSIMVDHYHFLLFLCTGRRMAIEKEVKFSMINIERSRRLHFLLVSSREPLIVFRENF